MTALTNAQRCARYYARKQERVNTLTQQLQTLAERVNALEAENTNLRDRVNTLTQQLQTLMGRVNTLEERRPPDKKSLPPAPPSKELTPLPLVSLFESDIPQGEHTHEGRKNGNRQEVGRSISPDWQPTEDDQAFAAGLGLSADAIAPEFIDYWLAAAGQNGRKRDWSATFRNRCRKIVASGHINGYQLAIPEPRGPQARPSAALLARLVGLT